MENAAKSFNAWWSKVLLLSWMGTLVVRPYDPLYIHTYIIGHYNPSAGIIDLVLYTTYVVCVNFIHKWRDLRLRSTPNNRFFEKLFMAILLTLRVFFKNLLKGNYRRNTFRILFWCLAWASNPVFSSNKPKHYLLHHGNYTTLPTTSRLSIILPSNFMGILIMSSPSLSYIHDNSSIRITT